MPILNTLPFRAYTALCCIEGMRNEGKLKIQRIQIRPRLSSQQPQAALKQEARRDSLKLGSRRLPLKLETRGRSDRLKLGDKVPV